MCIRDSLTRGWHHILTQERGLKRLCASGCYLWPNVDSLSDDKKKIVRIKINEKRLSVWRSVRLILSKDSNDTNFIRVILELTVTHQKLNENKNHGLQTMRVIQGSKGGAISREDCGFNFLGFKRNLKNILKFIKCINHLRVFQKKIHQVTAEY